MRNPKSSRTWRARDLHESKCSPRARQPLACGSAPKPIPDGRASGRPGGEARVAPPEGAVARWLCTVVLCERGQRPRRPRHVSAAWSVGPARGPSGPIVVWSHAGKPLRCGTGRGGAGGAGRSLTFAQDCEGPVELGGGQRPDQAGGQALQLPRPEPQGRRLPRGGVRVRRPQPPREPPPQAAPGPVRPRGPGGGPRCGCGWCCCRGPCGGPCCCPPPPPPPPPPRPPRPPHRRRNEPTGHGHGP